MRKWVKENKEYLREYHRKYRYSDMPGAVRMRDKVPEYCRKHRNKDIEKSRMRGRKHQQRRRTGSMNDVNFSIVSFFDDDLCAICGLPLFGKVEYDHIIPLSKGGLHVEANLRRLHDHCNRAKNSRLDDDISHHTVERCRNKTKAILITLNHPVLRSNSLYARETH